MPYFRHKTSKAVKKAAKSPGAEWDPIDGPEDAAPAEPDVAAPPVAKPKPRTRRTRA